MRTLPHSLSYGIGFGATASVKWLRGSRLRFGSRPWWTCIHQSREWGAGTCASLALATPARHLSHRRTGPANESDNDETLSSSLSAPRYLSQEGGVVGFRGSPKPRRVARSRPNSLPPSSANPVVTLRAKHSVNCAPASRSRIRNGDAPDALITEQQSAVQTLSTKNTSRPFPQPFSSNESQTDTAPGSSASGCRPGGACLVYSSGSSAKAPCSIRNQQQMPPQGGGNHSRDNRRRQQQQAQKRRPPALHAPQKRSLPGGSLSDAAGVSPLAVDRGAENRVLAMVRSDQQQASSDAKFSIPEPTMHHVPSSQLMRCVLELPLHACLEDEATGGKYVVAIGQSKKATIARALCFMHAEQLLDYYMSTRGASSSSSTADPPKIPPPLEEKVAASPPVSPQPQDYRSWDEYVDASAAYVNTVATYKRQEVFKHGEVPRSGHPIADCATEMLRRHPKRYCRPTALDDLNQSVRDASRLMTTVRLDGTVFVSTLVLDPQTGLTATGVSKNTKAAKRQCAAHALCILRLIQDDVDGRQAADGTGRWGRRGAHNGSHSKGKNVSHHPSVPLESILQRMQPAHRKIVQLHHLLFGEASLTPTTTFTKESKTTSGSTGTTVYRCHLTLKSLSCDGTGVNRFEAERAAMEAAMSNLMLYDRQLQAVQAFVNAYPSISPESIPSAALPAKLVVQLQSQLQPVMKQHAMGTSSTVTEDATEKNRGDGVSDDYISGTRARSMSEHALLHLSERAFSADPLYGADMLRNMLAFRRDPVYLTKFHPRRSTLAMATVKAQLLDAVQRHRVTVVCGTTGCGKTTQVPQYILDHEIEHSRGGSCNILVTQPRRLSSFSVAERIAQERLGTVGKDVGYAVRLDARPGRHITVCTTGVLLQILSTHPDLEHVSHLVIDEVHERDINCDVILALVKQLLERNLHLRVVLMSATMQADVFARYFGADTPVIQVDGAVYPVQVRYLADIAADAAHEQFYSPAFDAVSGGGQGQTEGKQKRSAALTSPASPPATSSRRANSRKFIKIDYNLIAYLVHRSVQVDLQNKTEGKSILVFLPGWKELTSAMAAIKGYNGPHALPAADSLFHIILLHSSVDSAHQRECFQPAPPGTVKLVLATNIAESGITIDDAAVVIDTGLIKTTTWESRPTASYSHHGSDANSFLSPAKTSCTYTVLGGESVKSDADGSSSGTAVAAPVFSTQLSLGYASQANCTQRKGRAGRTQGGVCYRLFTKELWDSLPAFPDADIHRVPLTQVLLKLLALGHTDPKKTLQTFIEPPSRANVDASTELLRGIGALGKKDRLTPLGEYLTLLPCDPRIGKMIIVGAVLGCLDSVLAVAACTDVCPYVTSRDMAAEARGKRYLLSRGSQSDHISFLNAYNAFCANKESEDFARLNLLHSGNLRIISKYKAQYRDILRQAGLISAPESLAGGGGTVAVEHSGTLPVPEYADGNRGGLKETDSHSGTSKLAPSVFDLRTDDFSASEQASLSYSGMLCVDTSPFSSHSFDVALVKACVCAALFPNVALLRPPSKALSSLRRLNSARKVELRTKHFRSIKPAKDSVCRRVDGPRDGDVPDRDQLLSTTSTQPIPALFYVFQDVFGVRNPRRDFLTSLSAVSLWALLLFGASESTTEYNAELSICVIDGWIALHIDSATYALLTDLRKCLLECLRGKFYNPHDPRNNSALEIVTTICRVLLKAPVQGIGAEAYGEDAKSQHSSWQLVDMGSIIDPFVHLRRGGVGDDTVAAVAEENALLDLDDDDDDDDGDDAPTNIPAGEDGADMQ